MSSDATLGRLAEALLPDLARRSGLELKEPVRLEMRTRDQLVRYLEAKLDEELPEDEEWALVRSYSLLGLVPDTLDLRGLLLELYTEQVAGFYEPDSTALFVLDDQPREALEGLLVHELVHAVQDQSADLDALTSRDVGNDRATAAQAAIEGHATLVMLEYMAEKAAGAPIDLGSIPDFSQTVRPALEGMGGHFPALSAAPEVIRESLLFPYLEGAGFVQRFWAAGDRVAPFGRRMPTSTEQIVDLDMLDRPIDVHLDVGEADVIHEDVLGFLELGVFMRAWVGSDGRGASGWGGDRYALVRADGAVGLVLAVAWDDETAADAFAVALEPHLQRFSHPARLDAMAIGGVHVAVLYIGLPPEVTARVTLD